MWLSPPEQVLTRQCSSWKPGGVSRVGRSVWGGSGRAVLAVEVGCTSTLTGQVIPKLVSRSAPIRLPTSATTSPPVERPSRRASPNRHSVASHSRSASGSVMTVGPSIVGGSARSPVRHSRGCGIPAPGRCPPSATCRSQPEWCTLSSAPSQPTRRSPTSSIRTWRSTPGAGRVAGSTMPSRVASSMPAPPMRFSQSQSEWARSAAPSGHPSTTNSPSGSARDSGTSG